jgi:NAD(P)H-hydrate epimerase
VADPGGTVLVVTEGDERLAIAGSGDVLSGLLGALLAQGGDELARDPFVVGARLAAAAAFLHGRAARLGPARGLVAGDLPERFPAAVASLERSP